MTRAEYKRLSRQYRIRVKRKTDTYASSQECAELYNRTHALGCQLGIFRQSPFGRWLQDCRNRRMYLIRRIADRKHSERVAAIDYSCYRRAA